MSIAEDEDADFDAAFEDMPDVLPTPNDPFSEKAGDKDAEEEDWDSAALYRRSLDRWIGTTRLAPPMVPRPELDPVSELC